MAALSPSSCHDSPMIEALSRLGSNVRAHVIWVLLPGSLVLCEIWLAVNWSRIATDGLFHVAAGQTREVNVLVGIITLAVLVAAAYGVGSLARSISWAIWSYFNRRPPFLPASGVLRDLRDIYGSEAVNTQFERFLPVRAGVALLEGTEGSDAPRGHQSRTFDPPHRYLLSYCKLWLQSHHPIFAPDHFEGEINILLALLVPIWVTNALGARAGGFWILVTVCATGMASVVLFWFTHLKQRDELFQAVKHFLFAQWLDPNEHPRSTSGQPR